MTGEHEKTRTRLHLLENSSTASKIRLKELEDAMSRFEAKVDTHVQWKHFVWIVGVIFMFMTVILGAIYVEVTKNGNISNVNQLAVSRIEGLLSASDIYYE